MAGKYRVRSISLPSRFHPASVRIEQEINSLKSLDASPVTSSNEVCKLLAGLEEAYRCADDLLSMQSTCEALSSCRSEEWVSDMFDGSVKLLDVCSTSRDAILSVKGHVQDIQSAIRRRKDDASIQRSICGYLSYRKQMSKNAMKMIALLKQVDCGSTANNLDSNSCRLIKVLKDVAAVTVSVFESLLTFLAASLSAKPTKWSVVSRLMNKRVATRRDGVTNEFASVEAAVFKSSSSSALLAVNTDVALERLAALEMAIGGIEDRLDCVFRCMVRLRVSLLNKMSS